MIKGGHEFGREQGVVYGRALEGGKREHKWCDCIIMSKIKEIT